MSTPEKRVEAPSVLQLAALFSSVYVFRKHGESWRCEVYKDGETENVYTVTQTTCTCKAAERNFPDCKHRKMVRGEYQGKGATIAGTEAVLQALATVGIIAKAPGCGICIITVGPIPYAAFTVCEHVGISVYLPW